VGEVVVLIVLALLSLLGSLIKKAGENAAKGHPSLPQRTAPPPMPPPWLAAKDAGTQQEAADGEGISLEEMGPETGEGVGGEDTSPDEEGPPESVMPEAILEQAEINQERLEFKAEAAHLTSEEVAAETTQAPPVTDEFNLFWDEEEVDARTGIGGVTPSAVPNWLAGRRELIRAVLAAEILGRPGGRRASRGVSWRGRGGGR